MLTVDDALAQLRAAGDPERAAGAAAWPARTPDLPLRLAPRAAATLGLVGLLAFAAYDLETLIYWTSPAAAFYPQVVEAAAGDVQ